MESTASLPESESEPLLRGALSRPVARSEPDSAANSGAGGAEIADNDRRAMKQVGRIPPPPALLSFSCELASIPPTPSFPLPDNRQRNGEWAGGMLYRGDGRLH